MQDAIIKGIGNSRYLKTVGEALSLYPTYEDFLQAMIEGTFPVDFNGINKDGWTQQGTPLNKANLLSDTVISTLGLSTGANSTPNDAFNVLANIGNVHVWRKTVVTEEEIPAGYKLVDDNTDRTLDGVSNALINLGNTNQRTAYINCADSITVDDGGGISLNSATTHYQANDALNAASWLRGKYIKLYYINDFGNWFGPPALDQNKTYYVPNDAQISVNSATIIVNKLQRVDAYPLTPVSTHITYLTSTNRNAYQEGGDAKEAGYVLGEVKTGTFHLTSTKGNARNTKLAYGDANSIQVSNNGTVSLNRTATTLDVSASMNDVLTTLNAIRGKYIEIKGVYSDHWEDISFSKDHVYFVPSDVQIADPVLTGGVRVLTLNKYQEVTGYPAIPAGTTIEYLGVLGDKTSIETGSYVGTGTYGSGNPNTLTFRFEPKFVHIQAGNIGKEDSSGFKFAFFVLGTKGFSIGPGSANELYNLNAKFDGNTLSWYLGNAAQQLNTKSANYFFIALG